MEDLAIVIDGQRLEILRKLGARTGRDLLSKLLGMFLDQTPLRLGELRQARAEDDFAQVERLAHSMKGSCFNLGLTDLAKLSSELEMLARQREPQECGELIDAVAAEYQRVSTVLRGAISASSSLSTS